MARVGLGVLGIGAASPTVVYFGGDDRWSVRVRVVDGALHVFAESGVGASSVEAIAQEAGVSRATLYRHFPGGKDAVIAAVVETESARLFAAVAVAMGRVDDLSGVLVAGVVEAARWLSAHRVLARVMTLEPGLVLAPLAFSEAVVLAAGDAVAPFLGRWLDPDEARRAGEWAARLVVSHLLSPSADVDLADPADAAMLVRRFLVPAVQRLRLEGPAR